MTSSPPEMKSIWFLVGLLLLAMGTVITAAGAYHMFVPPAETTVLFHLHPDFWWGLVMLVAGGIFYFGGRRVSR